MEDRVPDSEFDPRVPVLTLGQRVGPFGEVVHRLETEDLGEPARRRGRTGVIDAERQPSDVDLLVRHPIALGAPGPEPIRHDAAPRGAAGVAAPRRHHVLDRHTRASGDRYEPDFGLDVVERAGPTEPRARLPPRDASPLEHLAGVWVVENLDDPPTDARLAPDLDDAAAVAPEVDRAAHPPQIHLFGERGERSGGVNRYLDLGRDRLCLCHGFLSTCRLKERNWSSQCAWS